MATEITREDILIYVGPLGPYDCDCSDEEFFDWLEERPIKFAQQNPEAVLNEALGVAFNPPDLSKKYFLIIDPKATIETGCGELLAACSKFVPDLFIRRMTELLPLATRDVTRCTLFWGLGESNLPQSFELLKSLMAATSEYKDDELVRFIEALGSLGLDLKRTTETLILLRQIQDATSPDRKEVHEELEFYFHAIEKSK